MLNLWEMVKSSVEGNNMNPKKISRKLEDLAEIMKAELKKRVLEKSHTGIIFFVGDIHGDFNTLRRILEKVEVSSIEKEETNLVFLGDYIDRGPNQLECLLTLLEIWTIFPKAVILLRGNHEPLSNVSPYPHDFPEQLITRFGYEEGNEVYLRSRELFEVLPMVAIINKEILAVHGGLPTSTYMKTESLIEYLTGRGREENLSVAVELLWNDPIDEPLVRLPSPRGAGYLWGTPVTEWVKRNFGLKLVIRGHEPSDMGYKFNHSGSVLTLFSRMGPPYFNRAAAYVALDLSNELWAKSLLSSILFITE